MARQRVEFEGILPAMVTPFDEDGGIDEAALARLTQRLIGAGCSALIPCGSTGEFQAMSVTERERVTEVVIEAAEGRVSVAPHTGALSTREAIQLSQHAERTGAAAVMVVPPFYEPLPWNAVVQHLRAISDAIRIPIIFYNLPTATGLRPTAAQIADLAAIDGVDWIKDSSGDAVQLTELIQRFSDRVGIMNGWDSLTFYAFLAGSRACVWGAANVIPELAVELFDAAVRRRDLEGAGAIWSRIWPLCHFFETNGSYVAAVKAGCELIGEPAGIPRPPILPLDAPRRTDLLALLTQAGKVPVAG
jgi:dihydrodipicolinate synthase/N-acetylneuraminate lyase